LVILCDNSENPEFEINLNDADVDILGKYQNFAGDTGILILKLCPWYEYISEKT